MISTFEFQISSEKFAAAILSTLRTSPRCLPDPTAGFQLQRVRYVSAVTRNSKASSFRISLDMGPYDQGLGYEWVQGKLAQLAVTAQLDIASTSQIAGSPNAVPPLVAQPEVTIVLDLACSPAGGGKLAVKYSVSAVEAQGTLLPGVQLPPWASEQVDKLLDLKPLIIDLSESIASNRDFLNAGLAITADGTHLVVRAELSTSGMEYIRWENFLDGFVYEPVEAHDWSVFITSADIELSLTVPVKQAIRSELKDEAYRLITIDCGYDPQPGRAVFTLTPYLILPDPVGVTTVPIALTLSLDAQGRLVVDLDAYGLRDLVNDAKQIIYVAINLLLPIAGWFVSAAVNDAIGDALKSAPAGALGDALHDAPDGTIIEDVPGELFHYRVSIPLAVPHFVDGKFEALITTPDGVALAGRWNVRDVVEGELGVETSRFAWIAPKIPCGASGERVLRDFLDHPMNYASLYAQVAISNAGTAPIDICSVSVLEAAGPASGLKVAWTASRLPATIRITAPSSYADIVPPAPIRLEVRTTAGVFQATVPHPAAITGADVEKMRSLLKVQLELCDAVFLPQWFLGHGRFDLDWIIDPLVDPDYDHSWVSLSEMTVTGLANGAQLQVASGEDQILASSLADGIGTAMLATAHTTVMRGVYAAIDVAGRAGDAPERERSVTISQELLERRGTLRLAQRPTAVFAPSTFGGGRFLAVFEDGAVLIDATTPTRPRASTTWDIPQVHGVIADARRTLVFGRAGLFAIDRRGGTVRLDDEPVLDAAELQDGIALLKRSKLLLKDRAGFTVAQEHIGEDVTTVAAIGGQLMLLSHDHTETIDTAAFRALRRVGTGRGLGTGRLTWSNLDGRYYAEGQQGQYLALTLKIGQPVVTARYATRPWQSRAVRSGRLVLHLGDGSSLEVLRSTGPREILPVPGRATADASGTS